MAVGASQIAVGRQVLDVPDARRLRPVYPPVRPAVRAPVPTTIRRSEEQR